ncbi:hypothetical protein CDD83_4385 [Cordyceps sp. RAO-2017]|nr:hypothetical protein CDD83_4385 [Cordyceps sp. RAO-2017]
MRPYWALDARTLRRRAAAWHFVVRVRAGKASMKGDVGDRVPWLRLWTELISEFAGSLPDVDMPINYMDESRILLPFDAVADLVRREARDRTMPRADQVAANFSGLRDVDEAGPGQPAYDPAWHGPGEQYWHLAVKACGPHTPAHGVGQGDLSGPAAFPHHYRPSYGYKGYVQNWTAAKDPCLQPHIRQLHGTFIEPISLSSTEELIPLFGGSKLPLNNEILIPGAMYLTKREFYSGGDSHGPSWVRKKDGLIWRGDGSGGRARPHNWQHFHRHRLVDMLNGTSVSLAEAAGGRAMAFELPSGDLDPGFASVGAWLGTFADAAFVHLCPGDRCGFLEDRFAPVKELPMRKQFRYKFLPDADGNSFSARFRGFLRSTSLPLKATIYAEWHDDRLEPWLHFVPLDNTFRDLYAALGFFADGPGRPGDAAARFIAERGRQWAETVLRREDMRLYMWRLLLEWARVCDDRRQLLGFVDDLAEGRTGQ